ncbi:MAG: trypsin-like peptidase domain-containing protein, partial [Candidatus Poribacteria bacterium]|nr:trypsin-like peptidase domain-containing protein [Candidatus Poribacteria bacterium]
KLYYEGIIDFDKTTRLEYPEDADTSTARIESKKGRASTVHLMGWNRVSSEISSGSGFFVDKDKIATNIHVVARPGPIFVKLMDKETIYEVVGVTAFDVEYDLVVLKMSGEGTPLPLGDSDLVHKGEPVVAVGYPDGKYKVTIGNVHGIQISDKLLGTTAEIAQGNSGGPLLNSKGEVIGINTQSGDYSFAIPSNILKTLLTRSVSPEPLTQWQKRDHIRASTYYGEGEDRFNAKNYAKAIINFDNAILHNPKYIRAYNWRGRAKFRLGLAKVEEGNVAEAQKLYHAAIEDYTQAIKINPEFTIALNNRGQAKYHLGQSKAEQGNVATAQQLYQEAIDDYTLSIKIDPKYTFPYFHRGVASFFLGQSKANQGNVTEVQRLYQEAIDDYTHAIQLEPNDAHSYNNRGSAKHHLGQSKAEQGDVIEAKKLYQAAIEDYTKAISINPNYVSAYKNRGIVKNALGQSDEAEKDFTKAKELESK